MGLQQYRAKRDLKRTPEPAGAKTKRTLSPLVFVVQRHKASHLHYDFRVEVRGVLKSWAVPKGPSMAPTDKRLAMMVEDHPYDYKDFAGIIPDGNYGAGIVEIWDHGTYEPLEMKAGQDPETAMMHMIHKGSVKIRLKGRKLKGEFALVRFHGQDKSWLLIKHRDEYAVDTYDSENETPKNSAINKALAMGRTTGRVKKEVKGVKGVKGMKDVKGVKEVKKVKEVKGVKGVNEVSLSSGREAIKAKKQRKVQSASAVKVVKSIASTAVLVPPKRFTLRGLGSAAKVVDPIKPMLASHDTPAFDDADWIFELKWDGYRAIAETGGKTVRLYSRNGLSFLQAYPDVAKELQTFEHEMVLDGEIVALNDRGHPDFQLLQHAAMEPATHIVYYVFDLLELSGKDVTGLPLLQRKQLLRAALNDGEHVRYCDHVDERGKDFFRKAVEQDLEGIIGKRADSTYSYGLRSKSWVKIKNHKGQEAVIGGYTAPRNSRKHFGALLLGVYDKDKLTYVGHTGTGFDERTLDELMAAMKPIVRATSPFSTKVDANMPPVWVAPKLVCNIKFSEWTRDGHMRHPVFMGLRSDKSAREVSKEPTIKNKRSMTKSRSVQDRSARERKVMAKKEVEEAPSDLPNARDVKVGRNTVHLTNLNKVFWPDEGITKGDVLRYYEQIAPVLLPHLKDRPQSLYRTPNGVKDPGFFQKDAGGGAPAWVPSIKIPSDSRGGADIDYLLCNDVGTLLYMVNLGCIELNPWSSRKQHLLKPDYLVMDLDPSERNRFDHVVEAALAVKVVLDRIGAKSFCKTSGSTGLHVYIPTGGRYTYEQLAPVAKDIMRVVNQLLPKTTTLERSLAKRDKRKIYLDHLQNRKGQTIASVYCLRPKRGAMVSTPLAWKEVKLGLDPRKFNIITVPKRVARIGDLFSGVAKEGFVLRSVLASLKQLISDRVV